MHRTLRTGWFVLLTTSFACASSGPTPAHPVNQTKTSVQPVIPETPVSEKSVDRAKLVAVIDAGLGRFLRGVETKPYFIQGRFAGFEIISMYSEDERFKVIDPKPGDVVLRVNGKRIERPEQAIAVWESLRVASELRIAFLRDHKVQEVRYPIHD